MNIPELKNSSQFKGLYIVDFGDYSSVGFTASEVELLLESEKFQHIKVYKIHRAYPDGKMELTGITNQTFQLEQGMFFYSGDGETAEQDFKRLSNICISSPPPCRAKLHLAKYDDDRHVTALIFPAEYNSEMSSWLIEAEYKTAGDVSAGISEVEGYYAQKPEILDRQQLTAYEDVPSKDMDQLLADIKLPVQRLVG